MPEPRDYEIEVRDNHDGRWMLWQWMPDQHGDDGELLEAGEWEDIGCSLDAANLSLLMIRCGEALDAMEASHD